MTDRILEISEGPARLQVRHEQLVISPDGRQELTTPIAELAALVLTHPQVQLTQAVLAAIAEAGGTAVLCNRSFLPVAVLLPLQSHFTQTERFARQAQMGQPLRKRLWQQIVRAKIRSQAALLLEWNGEDGGLAALVAHVRSGDPDNVEAQAARRYWPLLFGDPNFRRDREAPNQNRHLNYGYAVLRAIVTRAICAAGLHPSFGLAHRNRYDPFSLAADLMEPLRPAVDRAVADWIRDHDPAAPLDPQAKSWLTGSLQARYAWQGARRTLFDWCARMASSLARVVLGEQERLEIPEVREPCPGDADSG